MILCIFIFLILIIFVFLIKINENFNNNDFNNFKQTIGNYKKKKYILIFTSGPSLKDFKKKDIPKHIWDNCYVIAVKNTINYLDKINIKPDFLVTNFIGAAKTLNEELIDKHKPLFVGINYGSMENLRKRTDFMVNLDWNSNNLENVKNNKNDIVFKNKNNKIFIGWGHTMMELAIPLSLELKPENVITIGWDIKNSKKYWNKETFVDWNNENIIINDFTVYLHKFLKDHFNVNIYKFSKKSGIKIPIFIENNTYIDIFSTNIFNNKNIYLIANNPNISSKTISYVNKNGNNKDSLVVRFGGDHLNLQKKILPSRNDIMIYRSSKYSFNKFNENYKKYKNIVYTIWDDEQHNLSINNKSQNNKYKVKSKYLVDNINNVINNDSNANQYISFISSKYTKNISPTQGFGTLINLIERTKYKTINLVGFTMVTEKGGNYGFHNTGYEKQYFDNNIRHLKNVHSYF